MRKKICFIISGTGYSGAEIVLNRYLKNNNYVDPYFIIIFNSKNVLSKFENLYGSKRVECLNLQYSKSKIRYIMPYVINKINRKLKNSNFLKDCDLIYVNNTTEGILVSKFISQMNKKSILHIHDMRQSYKHPYNNYLINKYFSKYDKIITVSHSTKSSWGMNDIIVLYNGLEENYFRDDKKINSIKTFAFIGSLNYRKGADYFIDSLSELIEETNAKFIFAFKDYDDELFLKLKKLESKRVEIHTNLEESQILELYKCIDVLVVPSRLDPLPTVIMEAEANKTLVIGNNVSGIPEMIPIKEFTRNIKEYKDLKKFIVDVIEMDSSEILHSQKVLYDYAKKNFKSDIKRIKLNSIIDSYLNNNNLRK